MRPSKGARPPHRGDDAEGRKATAIQKRKPSSLTKKTSQDVSLDDLAALIRQANEATIAGLARSVERAIETGALLISAKAKLQHGEWIPWLERQCGISARMAQHYMRISQNREILKTRGKNEPVSPLTLQGAIEFLAEPREGGPPTVIPTRVTTEIKELSSVVYVKANAAPTYVNGDGGTVPAFDESTRIKVEPVNYVSDNASSKPAARTGEELALLREFAGWFATERARAAVDPADHSEWKVLFGRVKAIIVPELGL